MALEFDCPNCQLRIQTPDETAGKQARCPRCLATSKIPYYSTPASPIRLVAAEIASPDPTNSAARGPNPFSDAFAPRVQSQIAPSPYGATNFENVRAQFPSRADVRRRLLVPAIGLASIGLIGFAFTAFIIVMGIRETGGNFTDYDREAVAFLSATTLSPMLMLLGAVAMFRGRGKKLAWIGAIAAVVPCSLGFPLSLLFGIWGLVVLMDPLADLVMYSKD